MFLCVVRGRCVSQARQTLQKLDITHAYRRNWAHFVAGKFVLCDRRLEVVDIVPSFLASNPSIHPQLVSHLAPQQHMDGAVEVLAADIPQGNINT